MYKNDPVLTVSGPTQGLSGPQATLSQRELCVFVRVDVHELFMRLRVHVQV